MLKSKLFTDIYEFTWPAFPQQITFNLFLYSKFCSATLKPWILRWSLCSRVHGSCRHQESGTVSGGLISVYLLLFIPIHCHANRWREWPNNQERNNVLAKDWFEISLRKHNSMYGNQRREFIVNLDREKVECCRKKLQQRFTETFGISDFQEKD